MIHPKKFRTSSTATFLAISGEDLRLIINKTRAILWIRGIDSDGVDPIYYIIPVGTVRSSINAFQKLWGVFDSKEVIFHISDAIRIPNETGEAMVKYNGEEVNE